METKKSYAALRDQPQYLKIIAANIVNRFGDSIDAIAFSWLMYEVTGSASLMALNFAANFAPTVLLQPIAGVFVDRFSKRRVMVFCDIGRGLVVFITALSALNGTATAGLLILMTVLNSTLESLRMPAGTAIVPLLLDEDKYAVGTALNQTLSRVFEFIGTACAGVIIAGLGVFGALVIDAVTFILSALFIFWIRVKEEKPKKAVSLHATKESFMEGFRYVTGNKVLIAVLVLGMLMNGTYVPMSAFNTVFVVEILEGGPNLLSAMQLSQIAGMALGAFITPKIRKLSKKSQIAVSGVAVGVCISLLALLPSVEALVPRKVLAIAMMAVIGIAIGMVNVIFSVAFMEHVDKDFLGRVGGITNSVLCLIIPVISLLCSGVAAFASVPAILFISGLLSVLLYLAVSRMKVYDAL